MKKSVNRILTILLVLALVIGVVPASNVFAADATTVTLLETSDIHGMFMNYDYAADAETNKGFVKIASVVKEQRAIDPALLLLDDGDTTQGNMVSDFRDWEVHPAIEALNSLKYDVWQVGNHELNYEFESFEKAIKAFKGEVLAANIYKKDGTRYMKPYTIKEVKGVKVAIIGIEAPHVPIWEASNPEHFDNMTFTTPEEEIGKVLKEVEKEKADAVVVLCHYGEDGEYDVKGMYDVAKMYADQVDAFLIGHAHSVLAKYLVNGEWQDEYSKDAETVMIETGTLGEYVGKVTLDIKDGKVTDRHVENIDTKTYENDPDAVKAVAKLHQASLEKASEVVGQVAENFFDETEWLPGIPYAFIQDSALVDLINIVQMKEANADVSMAALFVNSANLVKGDYRLKDGVNVYKYDNTLYGVKCTGKQLKAIMEYQAGRYFNQYKEGDVTISFNPDMRSYLYDMFAGVDYKIDISKPVGERIVDVMYKGAPLKDDEVLVLALNNYRYGQLVSFGMLNKEDEVYSSIATAPIAAVRDMISEYIKNAGGVTPVCDHNWEIIGADLDDPQAELIYEMIRNGEIEIPVSEDGRTPNVKSVNAIELREEGVLPALEEEEEETEPAYREYKVVKGDFLWKIAKEQLGSGYRFREIYLLNKDLIKDPDLIQIGWRLKLPA